MKISKWRKEETIENKSGMMVSLSESEALALILSLVTQILKKGPNTGRLEMHTDDGEYFSVSVGVEE